jgi:hypothetical protein
MFNFEGIIAVGIVCFTLYKIVELLLIDRRITEQDREDRKDDQAGGP